MTKVREHGWFRTEISAAEGGPNFTFTTGFWINASQPELIMFSLNGKTAHSVFADLFREAERNNALPVGKRSNAIFGNSPAYAFRVARRHYPNYLGWSGWFYGGRDDFPCLQIVWPDRAGLFPWETGSDPSFSNSQPDLTEEGWLASLAD